MFNMMETTEAIDSQENDSTSKFVSQQLVRYKNDMMSTSKTDLQNLGNHCRSWINFGKIQKAMKQIDRGLQVKY